MGDFSLFHINEKAWLWKLNVKIKSNFETKRGKWIITRFIETGIRKNPRIWFIRGLK